MIENFIFKIIIHWWKVWFSFKTKALLTEKNYDKLCNKLETCNKYLLLVYVVFLIEITFKNIRLNSVYVPSVPDINLCETKSTEFALCDKLVLRKYTLILENSFLFKHQLLS